jgi:hypothetical protein
VKWRHPTPPPSAVAPPIQHQVWIDMVRGTSKRRELQLFPTFQEWQIAKKQEAIREAKDKANAPAPPAKVPAAGEPALHIDHYCPPELVWFVL